MTAFSHENDIHDQYTGVKGGLERILSAGTTLLETGYKVYIALPVMDFNLSSLHETIDFFSDKGFTVLPTAAKIITSQNDSSALRHMTSIPFFRQYFSTMGLDRLKKQENNYCRLKLDIPFEKSLCTGLHNSITVDNKGLLRPCLSFRDVDFGSFLTTTPLHKQLVENKMYKYLTSLSKEDLGCKTCKFEKFCNPCIGRWHSETGIFTQPNKQTCNYAHAFHAYYNEVQCTTHV